MDEQWPKERFFMLAHDRKAFVRCDKPASQYDLRSNHIGRAFRHNGEVFKWDYIYPHDILREAAERTEPCPSSPAE